MEIKIGDKCIIKRDSGRDTGKEKGIVRQCKKKAQLHMDYVLAILEVEMMGGG